MSNALFRLLALALVESDAQLDHVQRLEQELASKGLKCVVNKIDCSLSASTNQGAVVHTLQELGFVPKSKASDYGKHQIFEKDGLIVKVVSPKTGWSTVIQILGV